MPAVLDHVTITASDLAASVAFYDAALAPLGLLRVAEFGDEEDDGPALEAAAWGGDGATPVLWVVTGRPPTRAVHLELRAQSRTEVEAFHAAGIAAGGRSHDAPRRWAIYRRGRYAATTADPDGNLVTVSADE